MRARRRLLGELEIAVLDRLWSGGPADVKSVHRDVGATRGLAANTIQSTLERLHRKGLAERRKRGRAYCYAARVSRAEWVEGAVRELVESVRGTSGEVPLAAFVDLAARAGEATLAELERLVRARRREDEP